MTGAAGDIGRELSRAFSRAGAFVALAGRQLEPVATLARQLEQEGGKALAVAADISRAEDVSRLVEQTLARFGHLDILVNNAALRGPTKPLVEVEQREWEEVLAVNVTGVFLCCRAVLPAMLERRRGKIVNVSSVAGKLAYPLRSPYATSKWALLGLTRTLAQEVGAHNIRVNAICPGPVAGDAMEEVIQIRAQQLGKKVDEVRNLFLERTALGRMVEPKQVADLALFLASPAADSITGQAFSIDSGFAL